MRRSATARSTRATASTAVPCCSRKRSTASDSVAARCSSACASCTTWRTISAFSWVTWSIWCTAWWICCSPVPWLLPDSEIASTCPATLRTPCATWCMPWPAWRISCVLLATCRTESSISRRISLEASAERCARLRTSEATTAKPRPCSPARAASTAAFSARMLVWKAIPSITAMISDMRPALRSIASTECTACSITPLPCSTAWRTWAVQRSAATAVSALFCTTAVTCSTLTTVCATFEACSSVRAARAWLSWVSVCPACVTRAALLRISATMLDKATTMLSSRRAICASSSAPWAVMRWARLPWAACSMAVSSRATSWARLL